jgi:hypothetical protein
MHSHTFGRSAGFAALAGLAVIPWAVLVAPLVGMRAAMALYLVGVAALAVSRLAPSRARGCAAGFVAVAVGVGLALATHTLAALALALGALFALARSAFFYRRRPVRAVAIEVALTGGGLLFARFLAGPSLGSMAIAVWGFLLVQSFFFLLGGASSRAPVASQRDPFDAAHERARALLDGLPI